MLPDESTTRCALQVRLLLVFLDVMAVGLAERTPVDVADLVSRAVLAVLGELDREALERALVQARHQPFHHQARDQLQPSETGQCGRVEAAGLGVDHGQSWRVAGGGRTARDSIGSLQAIGQLAQNSRAVAFSVAAGTSSSRWSMTLSGPIPSASAWKVVTIRCRSTGRATWRTSAMPAWSRPLQRGSGLGGEDQRLAGAWPAPHETHFLTSAVASGSFGRLARTRSRA